MKRILTTALVTAVAGAALASTSGNAWAAAQATANGAFTDNYKASYNGDPNAYDLRTWLALGSLSVGGTTFVPQTLPQQGFSFVSAADGLQLKGSDGTAALLTASTASSNVFHQGFFRIDTDGHFGLLQQERDRNALQGAPIRETLTITRSGSAIGTVAADYTYDAAVFNAPSSSIEYHGPGGRWVVNGATTRLDWEASAPAPAADTTAPVLSSVTIPSSTSSRTITVSLGASDNVKVTQVRMANEDGVWSAWKTYASKVSWTLSSSTASGKGVYAQVRDAAGNRSASLFRKTTFVVDKSAPVLSSVSMPTSTKTRTISMMINANDDQLVSQVRFANEDGAWSAWRSFDSTPDWTLSSSASSYKGVTVQVRDAAGNESNTIYTKIRCYC